MKLFFDKFDSLKGASFIGINNYTNKFKEVSNLNVLTGVNITNAKEKDLESLKNLNRNDLDKISEKDSLDIEVLKVALDELITSGEKNLSFDRSEKTNQSIGQAEAYIHLTNSVKMHKETTNIFVTGFINNKTVLVEGEYPKTNKRIKTICKDAIKLYCGLRMNDYRQYNVGSMDNLNITGSTLQMK